MARRKKKERKETLGLEREESLAQSQRYASSTLLFFLSFFLAGNMMGGWMLALMNSRRIYGGNARKINIPELILGKRW